MKIGSFISSLATVGLLLCAANAQALVNPTGRPVGGGEGYGDWVSQSDATFVVDTAQGLVDALKQAKAGDIVYVKDSAHINLAGHWKIEIPAGVTLASGRGHNGSLGALIYLYSKTHSEVFELEPLFLIKGPHVRVTGLRFKGPTVESDWAGCAKDEPTGIEADDWVSAVSDADLRIDNNEMWAWPHAAINSVKLSNVTVDHNHIHHNRRYESDKSCSTYSRGLGYGVHTDRGNVTIEANIFDHDRHDIASSGLPGTIYHAGYNLSVEGGDDHNFDVHGCKDKANKSNSLCDPDITVSGYHISIYDNTFLQSNVDSVVVRGKPQDYAHVYNNSFPQGKLYAFTSNYKPSPITAIWQRYYSGNISHSGNVLNAQYSPSWLISYGSAGHGSQYWGWRDFSNYDPATLAVGDFDGDGSDDIFRSNGSTWYVKYQARGGWKSLRSDSHSFSSLRFGDFNGDGRTDVFRTNGYAWYISWGGTSSWQKVKTSSIALSALRFGDFNGDGKTDVFFTNGSTWYVSWGAQSGWQAINSSGVSMSNLRFGDFNGDGTTDVFYDNGSSWYVSWSGQSAWQKVNTISAALSKLRFCDFNGDGKSDVGYSSSNHWKVSYSATSLWKTYRTFSTSFLDEYVGMENAALGDFNGDGKCDAIVKIAL
jgi:hypothetical protein